MPGQQHEVIQLPAPEQRLLLAPPQGHESQAADLQADQLIFTDAALADPNLVPAAPAADPNMAVRRGGGFHHTLGRLHEGGPGEGVAMVRNVGGAAINAVWGLRPWGEQSMQRRTRREVGRIDVRHRIAGQPLLPEQEVTRQARETVNARAQEANARWDMRRERYGRRLAGAIGRGFEGVGRGVWAVGVAGVSIPLKVISVVARGAEIASGFVSEQTDRPWASNGQRFAASGEALDKADAHVDRIDELGGHIAASRSRARQIGRTAAPAAHRAQSV